MHTGDSLSGQNEVRRHASMDSSSIPSTGRSHKDIKYALTEKGCWECTSHHNRSGYPKIWINGQRESVHRYVYRLYKGDIPKGMIIRHTCDNMKCINPAHLLLGTHGDNVRDRVERHRGAIGEHNGRHKLTETQVKEILCDITTSKMALARKYGVTPKNIRNIKQHKRWRYVR